MIDTFRHDLDREQTYLVLRALDSHVNQMEYMGGNLKEQEADRARARVEADDARALRVKMAQGL